MRISVVLGLQRGDEGKGRIVDLLAARYDVVARFNGGPNAGHTIGLPGGGDLRLHQVPSGILYPDKLNIIGNGVLLDPIALATEIKDIEAAGISLSPKNLAISDSAHLILPHHIILDHLREASDSGQGSTKRGIAFAASDKYERSGVRAELLLEPTALSKKVLQGLQQASKLAGAKLDLQLPTPQKQARDWTGQALQFAPYLTDTVSLLRRRLDQNAKVLAEGAQAFGIDIEHGMYPFVTSSHTTLGGVMNGLGVSHQKIDRVIGVIKAVKSHVGGGPFVTEIKDEKLASRIRGQRGKIDSEYGAATRRPRRIGYLDLPELRRAIYINGVTELALTKLDSLERYGKSMSVATAYKYKGKRLSEAPGSALKLDACQPIYQQIDLWPEEISDVRRFGDLPKSARQFVELLEKELEIPITMLGVGPNREQIVIRD